MKNYLRTTAALSVCLYALVLASCSTSWSPVMETDTDKYELRGDVVSMRSIPYKVDSTEDGYKLGELDPMGNNIYVEFNEDGNATLLRRYNRKGKVASMQTSKYDEAGRIQETELVSSSGDLLEKTVYTYRRGRMSTMKVTDGMDSLKKYEEYEYFAPDSVRVYYSFKENRPAGHRIMTYNDCGLLTGNMMYSTNGKMLSEFRMTYDESGRRDSIYSDNMLFGKLSTKMEYDGNGFNSSLTMSGEARTTVLRFDYKLDAHGNWIEKTTWQDDGAIPVKVEKREIEYAGQRLKTIK